MLDISWRPNVAYSKRWIRYAVYFLVVPAHCLSTLFLFLFLFHSKRQSYTCQTFSPKLYCLRFIYFFYYCRAYSKLNGYEVQGYLLKADYTMEPRGPGARSPRGGGGGGRGNPKSMPYSGNQNSPLRGSDFPLRFEFLWICN